MPVIDASHDLNTRTITIVADFAAPVERVWQIYADPRQLEQIWGPPQYPATFDAHDLTPGGRMHYYMTSPEGEKFYGFWKVIDVDEPRSFSFEDGFADADYNPASSMPEGRCTMTFESHDGGTRMRTTTVYATAEGLQKVLDMGVMEGSTTAINQIDALLAEQ